MLLTIDQKNGCSSYGSQAMKKILVIEDTDPIRDSLIEMLRLEGFEVIGAANGQIGLQVAQEHQPDLILCDIMMPDLTGYNVLTALQANPLTATIPFIFLTAKADHLDVRYGMELGADDYLTKPCTSSELVRAITARLEKQEVLQNHYGVLLQNTNEQLNQVLYYDGLTQLPNRFLLQKTFQEKIVNKFDSKSLIPLFIIGIDRFNRINDNLGYTLGNLLLEAVADRLKDCIGDCNFLAYLGGDRFAVLLTHPSHRQAMAQVAENLLEAINQPFLLSSQEIFVTASLGIVCYNRDAHDLDKLLQLGGRAMAFAKQQGGNQYKFYTGAVQLGSLDQLALETSLRYALERQEFTVYYQPQISLKTGQVVGAEALIRWYHPERGFIPPNKFIPIAEETGLILSIGEWVLETACYQVRKWQNMGFPQLRMAVNLSPRQFGQVNLRQKLVDLLLETGLKPELLELELTETLIVQTPELAAKILSGLRALGVRIALDDFGTGCSSLSYLERFQFDTLKIDRCFVQKVAIDAKKQLITKSIIDMAHQLKFKVVGEGIETVEDLRFLCENQCDEAQGYFLSLPLATEAFQDLLMARNGFSLPA